MLAKRNRLPSRLVSRAARSFSRANFLLFTLFFSRTNRSQSRAAVVVSKKVSSKATERNKLRRRIISALKELVMFQKQKYDIVVIVRKKAEFQEYLKEIKKWVAREWQKK